MQLNWMGGEHLALLNIGEIRAIEQNTETGIFEVYLRLVKLQQTFQSIAQGQGVGSVTGFPMADDVKTVVRLGLIGGGMEGEKAERLVRLHGNSLALLPEAINLLTEWFDREGRVDVGKPEAGDVETPQNV